MTGWWIMLCGSACAVGVLILLVLVSHELMRIERVMASFELSEGRAARRRKKCRARQAARRAEEEAAAKGGTPTDGSAPIVLEVVAVRGRVGDPGP